MPALADAVTRSTSTAVATRRMIMQASAVAGHVYPGPLDFKSDLSGRLCPMSPVIDSCPLEELSPGEYRLVEWEDLELGVVNCNGELLASEDRCSHDDGDLLDDIDCDAGTVECSRHGSVFVLRTGMPRNLLAYVPIDTFPVSVEDSVIKAEVD